MKKNILISILCMLLSACGGQEAQTGGNAASPKYRTTAPSLLYFKNMRSTYYEMIEQPGTRTELYRLRKFDKATQEPILIPVIANNWLKDEAYLMLEPAGFGEAFASPLTIRWETQSDSGLYRLQPATAARQQEMALQLYEHLKAGRQLNALAADSTWVPLFAGRDSRNYYLTTVRDYLRLTEAL